MEFKKFFNSEEQQFYLESLEEDKEILLAVNEIISKLEVEEKKYERSMEVILEVYDKYFFTTKNIYTALFLGKNIIDEKVHPELLIVFNKIIDNKLLNENKNHRVSLLKIVAKIENEIILKNKLNQEEVNYLLFSIRLSFKYPGIIGNAVYPLKIKDNIAINKKKKALMKDIVISQNRANSDGLNSKYLISQMKGGLSIDLGMGCPMGCAYCYRIEGKDVEKYKQRWLPKNFISEEESIRRLINHPWFTPHITPIGIHMSTTEAFLPQIFPSTVRLLELIDNLGLTNRVSIITKAVLTNEQIKQLDSFRNIDLDICVCYSSMKKSIEPSSNINRIDFLKRLQKFKNITSIGYYRPIIEGYNTSEETIKKVLLDFKSTGVKTIVIGGLKFSVDHRDSFMSQGLPLPKNEFITGKKYLSNETVEKIKKIYWEIFDEIEVRPQLFRRSSCSRIAARGGYISDYNTHYTNKEKNCLFNCSQHKICKKNKIPSLRSIKYLVERLGRENIKFKITKNFIIIDGNLSMFEKTFLMQNLYFPVINEKEYCKRLGNGDSYIIESGESKLTEENKEILKDILKHNIDENILDEIINIIYRYNDDDILYTLLESNKLSIEKAVKLLKYKIKNDSCFLKKDYKLKNICKKKYGIIVNDEIFDNEENLKALSLIIKIIDRDEDIKEANIENLQEEIYGRILNLDELILKNIFENLIYSKDITEKQNILIDKILKKSKNITNKNKFIENIESKKVEYILNKIEKDEKEIEKNVGKFIGYRYDLIKKIVKKSIKGKMGIYEASRLEEKIYEINNMFKENCNNENLVVIIEKLIQKVKEEEKENKELLNGLKYFLNVLVRTKDNAKLEEEWERLIEDKELYKYDSVEYNDSQKVMLAGYYMLNRYIDKKMESDNPLNIWGIDKEGNNVVHFISNKFICYKNISIINCVSDETFKNFYESIFKIRNELKDNKIILHGLIYSIKVARSKNIIDSIQEERKIGVIVPMWNEKERIEVPEVNSKGQNALRQKIEQIKWLFEDNIFIKTILTFIDDGDPSKSGIYAKKILEKEYLKEFSLDNKGDIRLYFFEDIIKRNMESKLKNRILENIIDVNRDSKKGGSIQWVMNEMIKEMIDYICYIDFDLTCPVDEIGILLNELVIKDIDMVIGSRKNKESYGYYIENQPNSISYLYEKVIDDLLEIDIKDFNVGYKMFTRKSLLKILPLVKEHKLNFDVELIALYSIYKYKIKEIGMCFLHLYVEGEHGCPRDYGEMLEDIKNMAERLNINKNYKIINAFNWKPIFDKILNEKKSIELISNM